MTEYSAKIQRLAKTMERIAEDGLKGEGCLRAVDVLEDGLILDFGIWTREAYDARNALAAQAGDASK
jgi:hypothetical protein